MSLGDTLLQLLFRFIVNTLYGAYLPRSYVGSDGLIIIIIYCVHSENTYCSSICSDIQMQVFGMSVYVLCSV